MDIGKMHEGLEAGRCAICYFMEKDESELLIQWAGAGEQIHDGLRNGELFCNFHFWKLNKIANAVTMAALNGFLLELFVFESGNTDVRQTEVRLHAYQDRQGNSSGAALCPLCGRLVEREWAYIEALAKFLEDKDSMSMYERSRGLCMPHFIKVFLLEKDERVKERLKVIHESHITELIHELEEFIKKKDPPQKWERTEDEKLSYWRSLEKLVGRQGTKWR